GNELLAISILLHVHKNVLIENIFWDLIPMAIWVKLAFCFTFIGNSKRMHLCYATFHLSELKLRQKNGFSLRLDASVGDY
ncbi:hypothetical protein ACJX0J_035973, partial [Zea mays]